MLALVTRWDLDLSSKHKNVDWTVTGRSSSALPQWNASVQTVTFPEQLCLFECRSVSGGNPSFSEDSPPWFFEKTIEAMPLEQHMLLIFCHLPRMRRTSAGSYCRPQNVTDMVTGRLLHHRSFMAGTVSSGLANRWKERGGQPPSQKGRAEETKGTTKIIFVTQQVKVPYAVARAPNTPG